MELTQQQKEYLRDLLIQKANEHDLLCEFEELDLCKDILFEMKGKQREH